METVGKDPAVFGSGEDLYVRFKLLQRQSEFLEIQEDYIKDEMKNLKNELVLAQEEVKRYFGDKVEERCWFWKMASWHVGGSDKGGNVFLMGGVGGVLWLLNWVIGFNPCLLLLDSFLKWSIRARELLDPPRDPTYT